jgi:hypothetical protein
LINWKEDIAFLKNELSKKHINLFFQLNKPTFEDELDKLSLTADKMSNIDGIRINDYEVNFKTQL